MACTRYFWAPVLSVLFSRAAQYVNALLTPQMIEAGTRPLVAGYEDYEKDERVLNDQTGHKKSVTRREVYQERERETIRARYAETRRPVRNEAFGQQLLTTEEDRQASRK